MRTSALSLWLLLALGLVPALTPAVAQAEDESDDDFETLWIGGKLGVWYHPEIDMKVQVGGLDRAGRFLNDVPSDIDIKRDLGVRENVHSEYLIDFDQEAVLELELFFESEWLSVFVQWVAPYEYRGQKTLVDRDITFGGFTFQATSEVRSRFAQAYLGADVEINIFNTRYFRISPLVAIRSIAIDWEVQILNSVGGLSQGEKGDTSDIDSPMQFGDWQVFPYPEVGLDVRVGYRDIFEVGLKVAGLAFNLGYVEGGSFRAELWASLFPIEQIGITLGIRHYQYDFKATDFDLDNPGNDDRGDLFDFDLEFTGMTFGIIVRL